MTWPAGSTSGAVIAKRACRRLELPSDTIDGNTMTNPAILRLTNRHTGEVLEIRREERNGETVFGLRGTLPAHRQGPPLHIHHLEDEEGTITAGTLSAEVRGQRLTLEPGEVVQLPHGVPHRWWNDGDQPLAFEGYTHPAVDLDRYLQAVFEVMNASPANRPSLFYLAHIALRHRRTQSVLVMPRAIQAVLFRVVVVLGALLGRYRGTEWPGCPARCTGAPEAAAIIASGKSSSAGRRPPEMPPPVALDHFERGAAQGPRSA
jgi:quercetin dioxygenase-like cupin family protein